MILSYWYWVIDIELLIWSYWYWVIDMELLILSYWYWVIDIELLILSYWYWIFDIESLVLSFWYWVIDIELLISSYWYWVIDIEFLILSYWYWVFDIGLLILSYWYWVIDIELLILSHWYWVIDIELLIELLIELFFRGINGYTVYPLVRKQFANWEVTILRSSQRTKWAIFNSYVSWPEGHISNTGFYGLSARNGELHHRSRNRMSLVNHELAKVRLRTTTAPSFWPTNGYRFTNKNSESFRSKKLSESGWDPGAWTIWYHGGVLNWGVP